MLHYSQQPWGDMHNATAQSIVLHFYVWLMPETNRHIHGLDPAAHEGVHAETQGPTPSQTSSTACLPDIGTA